MHRGILMSACAMLLVTGAACAQKTDTPGERRADSTASAAKDQMGRKDSVTARGLDVNSATKAELTAAGWGQYADAIIASRPYRSMDELWQRRIVPRDAYDKGWTGFQVGTGATNHSMDKSMDKSMEKAAATPVEAKDTNSIIDPDPKSAGTSPPAPR